ncbi:MAG: diacylglycerol kinase, partial [Acidimicrobiaceae bacterium]|nr:diacylglycerol kinase [Acidimicrobiaceae bacterium]
EWARVLTRLATGRAERSKLVHTTRGRKVDVKLSRPMPYELDGGARTAKQRLRAKIKPGAITICVPEGNKG